uniref:Uncharacterized protein n=1 Tax=Panagrolaimus superbus TaxID=310955 RepID=A0A914ZAY1_9BILA
MSGGSKKLLTELTKLASMSISSSKSAYPAALDITQTAFHEPKPLFANDKKPEVAKLMEKSIPIFDKAFESLNGGSNPDKRQKAQISRSGLQFMVEEFESNQDLYRKIQPLLNASGVKSVEEYIQKTTTKEQAKNPGMDTSKIPVSHFWWFNVEGDE